MQNIIIMLADQFYCARIRFCLMGCHFPIPCQFFITYVSTNIVVLKVGWVKSSTRKCKNGRKRSWIGEVCLKVKIMFVITFVPVLKINFISNFYRGELANIYNAHNDLNSFHSQYPFRVHFWYRGYRIVQNMIGWGVEVQIPISYVNHNITHVIVIFAIPV